MKLGAARAARTGGGGWCGRGAEPCTAGARKDINDAAGDFYLYSLYLATLNRAEVQDDRCVKHAEFRAVVQF